MIKIRKDRKDLSVRYRELTGRQKKGVVVALSLTLVFFVTVPVLAWLVYYRKVGDLQYVDSPTKLYITAAHGEEIKYLDMADIQVANTSATSKYYVFAVSGSNADAYNLQLAYTTNNQFEYYLYPAKEVAGIPGNNVDEPHPMYVSHTDNGTGSNYYYVIDKDAISHSGTNREAYRIQNGSVITRTRGSTSEYSNVTAEFLNRGATPANAVIDANETKHVDTYAAYSNVQDCAEPIYWQVRNIKSDMDPTTRDLLDYYILEVNWENIKSKSPDDFSDNGETDIIYISVAVGYVDHE